MEKGNSQIKIQKPNSDRESKKPFFKFWFIVLIVGIFGIGYLVLMKIIDEWQFKKRLQTEFKQTPTLTTEQTSTSSEEKYSTTSEEKLSEEKNNTTSEEQIGKLIKPSTSSKELIILGERNCKVYFKIDNPYRNGEQIAITEPCTNNEKYFSIFRINNDLAKLLVLKNEEVVYPYGDIPEKKLVKFLNADEIIYEATFGEGQYCARGEYSYVNKINLTEGIVEAISYKNFGSSCHNDDESCYDDKYKFYFEGKELLKVSFICQDGTNEKEFKIEHAGKILLSKRFPKSKEIYEIFDFSLLNNTYDILKGSKNIKFKFEDKIYSLNIETGQIK